MVTSNATNSSNSSGGTCYGTLAGFINPADTKPAVNGQCPKGYQMVSGVFSPIIGAENAVSGVIGNAANAADTAARNNIPGYTQAQDAKQAAQSTLSAAQKIENALTNKSFWKGTALLIGGSIIAIIGVFFWLGKGASQKINVTVPTGKGGAGSEADEGAEVAAG